MPKFYGQNKKRIDPRYFLEETTNRDEMDQKIDPDLNNDGQVSPDALRRMADAVEGGSEFEDLSKEQLLKKKEEIEKDKFYYPRDFSGERRDHALNQIWAQLEKHGIQHPYARQEGDMEDSWMGGASLAERKTKQGD